jgi:hypothetical protein
MCAMMPIFLTLSIGTVRAIFVICFNPQAYA